MTLQQMQMVMGDGSSSYYEAPVRFVDFTLEVSDDKDTGTDHSLSFSFNNFNGRISITKYVAATWIVGGENDPQAPNMPQWHEDYPTDPDLFGGDYETAYISTVSLTGVVDGVNDIRWAGNPDPDSHVPFPDWHRISTPWGQASITENPGGLAHTSEWVAIYQIRRYSDQVVIAQAQVTLRIVWV